MFEVLFGGAETTVQDMGCKGWFREWISPSGAQDNFSFRVGNILLKNREGDAALEMTVVGPQLRVREDTVVAFTGADMSPKINGKEVGSWETIKVASNDIISFGSIRAGCRGYLCVAGGVNVPTMYGSRSTGTLNKIGGYQGRKLEKGDLIQIFKPAFPIEQIERVRLPPKHIPIFSREVELRFVLGMFDYLLTEESFRNFFQSLWTVTPRANRVAYYLKGPKFEFIQRAQPFGGGDHPSNVVDIPYPIGSVQVPGGQNAVLLLNDAVTGGGYATIGTVVKPDLDVAAQLKPGDHIVFKKIGISEALAIRRRKEAKIEEIKEILQYPF